MDYYEHYPSVFEDVESIRKLPVVYALSTHDFAYVKLGMTSSLKQRFINIQTACPFKLFLWLGIRTPIPEQIESYLHKKYKEFRVNGEWFSFRQEQLDELLVFFSKTNKHIREVKNGR